MSWNPAIDPICPEDVESDAIETVIIPRSRDLGGFEVRRGLRHFDGSATNALPGVKR